MLIFNNRQGSTDDFPRYRALALQIIVDCVNNFNQYIDADVPCQKLTEGLEGLYYALASYFLIHNVLTPFSANSKAGGKRNLLFETIWPSASRAGLRAMRVAGILVRPHGPLL